MERSDTHLALFLTRATPLRRWEALGILDREVALVRRLACLLGSVTLVTDGGPEELDFQGRLGEVRILHNRWGLSPNLYSLLAPILHWRSLRRASIYRTNQLDGSWTALLAGALHRKPVIVRAGYLWAENNRREGKRGPKAGLIDRLQALAFRRADRVILTTPAMQAHVVHNYRVSPEKIRVIPNYVDTGRFKPDPSNQPEKGRVCFIGRLHPSKNIHLLIEAVAGVPGASLIVIGQGEQRSYLETLASACQARVSFSGMIPNDRIPFELNRSQVFVLPSAFEGHPKALIEAMACGVAVVGSDVAGIREVIQHEKTGLLCPPTATGIRQALQRLLENAPLRHQLGRAAHDYAQESFSLDGVVALEQALLQEVEGRG